MLPVLVSNPGLGPLVPSSHHPCPLPHQSLVRPSRCGKSDLSRIPDGVGLQIDGGSLPITPLYASTGRRPLHELVNNAVLVSVLPGGDLPRELATSTLYSWARFNYSGSWGLLGPRAVTEAWVEGVLVRASAKLYAAETFGFATCIEGLPAGRRSLDPT